LYIYLNLVDDICFRPTKQLFARLQIHLLPHWNHIRYEFVQSDVVDAVECTSRNEVDKCCNVLNRWIEIDKDACCCDLLRALQKHQFNHTVEKLKKLFLEKD